VILSNIFELTNAGSLSDKYLPLVHEISEPLIERINQLPKLLFVNLSYKLEVLILKSPRRIDG